MHLVREYRAPHPALVLEKNTRGSLAYAIFDTVKKSHKPHNFVPIAVLKEIGLLKWRIFSQPGKMGSDKDHLEDMF